MKNKIIFFLALVVPVLIFLFLKAFGRNEFDIPVFYKTTADSLNNVCGTHYKSPYTLPDSVLSKLKWKPAKATVFVLDNSENSKDLKRLSDTFAPAEFTIVPVKPEAAGVSYQRWISCVFFADATGQIILMDGEKRIRGYYKSDNLDETDRLIVEMKILLKKY